MTAILLCVLLTGQAQPATVPSREPEQRTISDLTRRLDEVAEAQQRSSEELREMRTEMARLRSLLEKPTEPRPTKPPDSISIEGAPAKGSPTAPLILVEFADFECPFCRTFSRETLPLLERDFVATGKLQLVFHNFPLERTHASAFEAAVAGLCAHGQGRFWDMHDRLLRAEHGLDAHMLEQQAREVGLDLQDWRRCVTSDNAMTQVRDQMLKAMQIGIAGTPTLLIGTREPGGTVRVRRIVQGAQPFETLTRILYSLSASSTASP